MSLFWDMKIEDQVGNFVQEAGDELNTYLFYNNTSIPPIFTFYSVVVLSAFHASF